MTEQGAQAGRFRLDLEINDEEDPGYTDRLIEGLGVQHLGEQPFRVGGNFPTHRFVAVDPHRLLELAHRWVDVGGEGENLDAWEMVEITEQATGRVVPLLVRERDGNRSFAYDRWGGILPRSERFDLLNFDVRVTAPISWTDVEENRGHVDEARAFLRGVLEDAKGIVEQARPGMKVEFEL